jgi:AraC family transcriptional regulator, arabinose operon regulatory protein
MNTLTVTSLGIRREEAPGFTIDRPQGMGQAVFVRFYTPMEIRTEEGIVTAEPGCCLFYEPGFPQWYRGHGVGLVNDWMHLQGALVGQLATQYEVPMNIPLAPRESGFVPGILEGIWRERHSPERFREEAIRLLVEELFLKLSRQCTEERLALTPAEAAYLPAFRSLRMDIHQQLQERWHVEEMARRVHLSPSRFAALYRRFFGVSPMEDLIRVRLENARTLLTNRAATVSEAAVQSGFENECYFSRLFRRRVGCAPRDYYRSQFGNR